MGRVIFRPPSILRRRNSPPSGNTCYKTRTYPSFFIAGGTAEDYPLKPQLRLCQKATQIFLLFGVVFQNVDLSWVSHRKTLVLKLGTDINRNICTAGTRLPCASQTITAYLRPRPIAEGVNIREFIYHLIPAFGSRCN